MNSKKIIIQSYDGIFKEKINSIKPRNVKELIKIINKAKKKKLNYVLEVVAKHMVIKIS